jgi:trans-aconitate 2-methyltransferase
MPWDPELYQKFQTERSAPFDDLLGMVEIRPGLRVVDLGCGTGELTLRLAKQLPGSDVLGIDASPSMLQKAAPLARPGLRFEQGDQAELSGEWDLIFSNAALHWTENHQELIGHLFGCLREGGQLAVQVPSNHHHISQQLIAETARSQPFATMLHGFVRQSPVLGLDGYAQTLFDLGAAEIVVLEKIYPHVLSDSDAVVEWLSGTSLVPYFERLGVDREQFLGVVRDKMRAALPGSPVFYPFRRTLLSARRTG